MLRAAGWMMTAVVSFTLIAIAGREASKGVPTVQLIFWRSFFALVLLTAGMFVFRQRFHPLLTDRIGLHWVRNAIHFVAQFSWLYALTLIPLAQLFSIEFTAPLWVAVLAPLLLGERMTTTRLVAAVLGFVGVLAIVRPGYATLSTGAIFALVAAIGFAGSMICTKSLTRTESTTTVLFYMFALQTLIALVPAWPDLHMLDAWTWMWVFLVAVLGLASHFALTRAFSLADAMVVAPMDFLRLPLIVVIGWIVYAEALDPWVLLGGSIVILGNIVNMWGERRRSR
jgi:drug/metabolite transporter (DMT)-like permease